VKRRFRIDPVFWHGQEKVNPMNTKITSTPIFCALLALSLFFCVPALAQRQKIRVIADQDSAGPQGTNFLSLLMLLRAPEINLLGITTVSGDQWVEPATVFALWATELTGRTDVPVIKGAENPLVNSKLELERREALYGSSVGWHGSFNPDAPKPSETWAPPGGFPKVKARPGRAADFIIETIHANPGEVVLYCAGPLTNVALAVRMDPTIVPLTKAIYIMGGSSQGGSELNWTWVERSDRQPVRSGGASLVERRTDGSDREGGRAAGRARKASVSGCAAAGGYIHVVHDVGRIARRVFDRPNCD
jgi:hypothetical protein